MKISGNRITQFAVLHSRFVVRAVAAITILLVLGAGLPTLLPGTFGVLPAAQIDTDPETMLPAEHPARVFHNESKEKYGLSDAVFLGVVNDSHEHGVFNTETLGKVFAITEYAKKLEGVIAADVMAPSTVDSIGNDGPGTVTFDWLMAEPPTSQEEALAVRDRAMRIPFLKDTLVSHDGKALVIYVPIEDKDVAHEVAVALQDKLDALGTGKDQFHIAGLPVAEDTFGIEMFIQMAISAPVAMLVIFLLMWFYFRRFSLIVSPMLVAMAAALSTMALLVITGNTIHIMSSMIPIFIMPIAVLDAVHIISDFFDTYQETRDRRKTIEKVMHHLSSPMLFTSLTTAAGFGSLAFTPIPPVQTFGIFVAFGVLAAWFFTIVFVPAYIMLLPEKRLLNFGRATEGAEDTATGLLGGMGRMRRGHAKLIVLLSVALVALAAVGIDKIRVNDNPTKWFEEDHPIRVADRVLNQHFGGTYDAYLEFEYDVPEYTAESFAARLAERAFADAAASREVFAELGVALTVSSSSDPMDLLDELDALARSKRMGESRAAHRIGWSLTGDFLAEQYELAEEIEESEAVEAEESEADGSAATFGALMAQSLEKSSEGIASRLSSVGEAARGVAANAPADEEAFLAALRSYYETLEAGEGAGSLIEGFIGRAEQADEVFKRPDVLAYLEKFQQAMQANPAIGKSNSLADIVKVVHRDLMSGEEADYRLPATSDTVGQTLAQYQSSHRKDDLWHFVTTDYQQGVVWFQLKSGDNREMESVLASVDSYLAENPPPISMTTPKWFGLTYINVVWQNNMVTGMVGALLGSFVIVLIMMTVLFRSLLWGILSMIPLTLTVGLIYGVLGLIGKDYDMPVAVLSSLSLGLAVDYAIHFLARARELRHESANWAEALEAVFGAPARAISRNVIVVGVGFLPLLLAPLVPYQTVGILIAAILLLAGIATLGILPALITLLEPWLFKSKMANSLPEARSSRATVNEKQS
ncbi:MAG: MMPL family transporter [Myxococcales bacterium]|nr:MMPL family transporter [Myxococcales bacterium]